MLLKIYTIGIVACMVWFLVAAILTFEKKFYESTNEEGKEAIDHMHDILNDINPNKPEIAFFIISIMVSLTWPVTVPYLIFRNLSK